MISFTSDYIAGAHPALLRRLAETNLEVLPGYEKDAYCVRAAEKIRAACACPDAEVFFLVGGTQTNQVVISTVLKDYQGVISAKTGHINAHEAGAIEYSGHKVLALDAREGKLAAADVDAWIDAFEADPSNFAMVHPGMVYISYPTEYGTLYSKDELAALHEVCRRRGIPLYIDGARLGYALCSPACDLTLPELASLCDVFYIGGTKVGALCGEAVVFPRGGAPDHFMTRAKARGAMLEKGRLLGIQFDAFFTDGLYFEIGRHGIEMAEKLKEIMRGKGIPFFLESPTNQQFVILENARLRELAEKVEYEYWEPYDAERSVVRFATSWSTTDADLDALRAIL